LTAERPIIDDHRVVIGPQAHGEVGTRGDMRNAPPELIDGRFRVERLVARGGMGSVYFARDEQR
jgi:hypothetical protein